MFSICFKLHKLNWNCSYFLKFSRTATWPNKYYNVLEVNSNNNNNQTSLIFFIFASILHNRGRLFVWCPSTPHIPNHIPIYFTFPHIFSIIPIFFSLSLFWFPSTVTSPVFLIWRHCFFFPHVQTISIHYLLFSRLYRLTFSYIFIPYSLSHLSILISASFIFGFFFFIDCPTLGSIHHC